MAHSGGLLSRFKRRLSKPEWAALLPAAMLVAYWAGGERGMVSFAVLVPIIAVLMPFKTNHHSSADVCRGFGTAQDILDHLDQILERRVASGQTTACFLIAFDDPDRMLWQHQPTAMAEVSRRTAERLADTTRQGDMVAVLDEKTIAVALGSVRRLDLEAAVQIASRLRKVSILPLVVAERTLHPSVSIGFCRADQSPGPDGRHLLDAARCALDEAALDGPGAIRSFQPQMTGRRADRTALRGGLEQALDAGQIRPWFQPQVCADTGRITGFEALARWHHPDRGILSPAEFLPLVEEAGLFTRLGEVILYGALSALSRWDKAGLDIAQISVNFSATELSAPNFAEHLKWELDRFNLAPARLTLEVLESVASQGGDNIIALSLAQCAKLGCGVDLDDFGTGQASIANIRRFSIRRVKIDRSFVTRVDTDPDQKQVVAAILGLCDRLGVQTVAEGVETPGEHATLAQLGCQHVQGFGIARPMAMEETFGWIERHRRGQPRLAAI